MQLFNQSKSYMVNIFVPYFIQKEQVIQDLEVKKGIAAGTHLAVAETTMSTTSSTGNWCFKVEYKDFKNKRIEAFDFLNVPKILCTLIK